MTQQTEEEPNVCPAAQYQLTLSTIAMRAAYRTAAKSCAWRSYLGAGSAPANGCCGRCIPEVKQRHTARLAATVANLRQQWVGLLLWKNRKQQTNASSYSQLQRVQPEQLCLFWSIRKRPGWTNAQRQAYISGCAQGGAENKKRLQLTEGPLSLFQSEDITGNILRPWVGVLLLDNSQGPLITSAGKHSKS